MSKLQLHKELKIALIALDSDISEFSRNLTKKDGTKGVSHTYVIRVAQAKEESEWVEKKIRKIIAKAKKEHPDFYRKLIHK